MVWLQYPIYGKTIKIFLYLLFQFSINQSVVTPFHSLSISKLVTYKVSNHLTKTIKPDISSPCEGKLTWVLFKWLNSRHMPSRRYSLLNENNLFADDGNDSSLPVNIQN